MHKCEESCVQADQEIGSLIKDKKIVEAEVVY
jgi:hypothetical protein